MYVFFCRHPSFLLSPPPQSPPVNKKGSIFSHELKRKKKHFARPLEPSEKRSSRNYIKRTERFYSAIVHSKKY